MSTYTLSWYVKEPRQVVKRERRMLFLHVPVIVTEDSWVRKTMGGLTKEQADILIAELNFPMVHTPASTLVRRMMGTDIRMVQLEQGGPTKPYVTSSIAGREPPL